MGVDTRSGFGIIPAAVTHTPIVPPEASRRATAVLIGMLLLAALEATLVACGGGGKPVDLVPVRDALPVFPGASLASTGTAPPGLLNGKPAQFTVDQQYFIAGFEITREDVLAFYRQELPKQGWKETDPKTASKNAYMDGYCSASPWISCVSFVTDAVGLIISAPMPLGLNPITATGSSFHIHLEAR